jgi:hypothetical protein
VPGGRIEITNHGLESGVHALPGHDPRRDEEQRAARQSSAARLMLRNPLHMQDAAHDHSFSELPKDLQRLAESRKDEYKTTSLDTLLLKREPESLSWNES